jgi:H+-translocating NAD(P) transhydrogenase subunit beta
MALKIQMTAMPQMVALLNGFGGGASALVAGAALADVYGHGDPTMTFLIATGVSGLIGGVTFSGSIIAFDKLQEMFLPGKPIFFPAQQVVSGVVGLGALAMIYWIVTGDADTRLIAYGVLVGLALIGGVLLTIPIGGADMPVAIALLNSYSGLAAAATGFVLGNNALIITGSLVGASGFILTQIMCKAMNRSLINVLTGGGTVTTTGMAADEVYAGKVKATSAEEIAMLLDGAGRVVIVPGLRAGSLAGAARRPGPGKPARVEGDRGRVRHPSRGRPDAGAHERAAGRGRHLLRQAEGDGRDQPELPGDRRRDRHRRQRRRQPAGADGPDEPDRRDADPRRRQGSHGHRHQAQPEPGFAGIPNPLFAADNTLMYFSDGKKAINDLIAAIKEA